jgi:transposase-like protein
MVGLSVRLLGRRLIFSSGHRDLTESALRAWVRQAEVDAGRGKPGALTTEEREELGRLRREVKTLRLEREILLPTGLLCRALRVSRSGFYAWSKRPPSRRDVEDSKLVPVIRACHAQSRATYGSPRVHKDLQALSYRLSRRRVARLMRREGLSARPPRRYRATTDSKYSLAIAPNVVAREFHAAAPNRV